MTSTRRPGCDPDSALATHGGPGWRPRRDSHADEITHGELWRPYRVCSETATLKAVLLAVPGEELAVDGTPDDSLMLQRVDVTAIQRQCHAVADHYTSLGVEVHLFRPHTSPPPNFVFQRDLFFMTPQGAILGRPAAQQRAGEERFAAEALASLGVPILRSMSGRATFEGADALWLDEHTVLLGVGLRTNDEARGLLEDALAGMGVQTVAVSVPRGVQHLLGVVNFLDRDLAAVHGGAATDDLLDVLRGHGVDVLLLPPNEELDRGRGMNFVTTAPRRVVMPTGCPGIQQQLVARGVDIRAVDVTEYIHAAGALGCLTGVLWRE